MHRRPQRATAVRPRGRRRASALLLVAGVAFTAVACDDDDDAPADSPVGTLGTVPGASTPGGGLEPGSNLSTPSPPTASDVTPASGAAITVGG